MNGVDLVIYKLAQNGVSSLNLSIEYFKKLFYFSDRYNQYETDDNFKICITFLENAIELLLKTILVNDDPLSIYESPESKTIKKALLKVSSRQKLEDILISEGSFRTIKYFDTIKKYNEHYHKSDKIYNILSWLGEIRNAITHFGVSIDDTNELIVSLIDVYDVIYNYLYPQLLEIDSIEEFFTSDALIVKTIHGLKPLFDDDYTYNNILDFLDELLEESERYSLESRLDKPKYKINEFIELMKSAVEDPKFSKILYKNNANIEFEDCDYEKNDFYFNIVKNGNIDDTILSCYSRYFNVTSFCNESGRIYFVVAHNNRKIYVYKNFADSYWPQISDPEPDEQWEMDFQKGLCDKMNLSKNNILIAFDVMTKSFE